MLTLIVLLIAGLGIAFFAMQNTDTVSIALGQYLLTDIPLYLVAAGSLLLGLFIAWIMSLLNALSTSFALRGKDNTIKESEQTVASLKNQIHELELENARLRGENKEPVVMRESEEEVHHEHRPSFFERIRHSFR